MPRVPPGVDWHPHGEDFEQMGRHQSFPADDIVTPEDEATFDAQEAEREDEDWLASWSDDFNSDEWLAAADAA